MTHKDFYILFGAALEDSDKDRYIAEWSGSTVFYPDPDADGPAPESVLSDLCNIWDVAHMSFADIRNASGLTQAAFAERFCIPRRTVENWCTRNSCPDYVRLMLCDLLCMCTVRRDG